MNALKNWIDDNGITQEKLAAMSGKTLKTVWSHCNGGSIGKSSRLAYIRAGVPVKVINKTMKEYIENDRQIL